MNIFFAPFISPLLLNLLALILVLCAALSVWWNWRSGIFRVLALASILGLLWNPQTREAEKTALDDIAVILVDESDSQNLQERRALTANTADKLEEKLTALGGIEVRRHAYNGEEETRTVEAMRHALADTPSARLGGVFIVTDGQTIDGDDAERTITTEAPTHLLITGAPEETDRKITLTNAPRYGIVGQSVRVAFRIDDLGPDEKQLEDGGIATVVLRINGEEILREPVPIGSEAGFDAPLDRPGALVVELEVEERPSELTTRNNTAVLPITAIRDRLRVLLISGEPHAGERVWRNLLKSDPAVDLVHFTILRPLNKNDGVPVSELALIQFPQDELFIEKLTEFDLLIFDRYTYRGVLDSYHFDNIARYVEGGGAVLISAGPEFAGSLSLAARRNLTFILPAIPAGPAVEGPFRAAISALGMRHPVTADLKEEGYWGRWLRIMPVIQREGQTLMSGPSDAPLLILNRTGEGRVGLILSDHVWLWARGFDGGGPHAELLRRIAHWLMKEPELEEEALTLTTNADTLIINRRSIAETTPTVELTFPSGETVDVALTQSAPGKFEAMIENAPRGLYRAQSEELFAIGAVGLAAPPEFQNVIRTSKQLLPLANSSGGGVFLVEKDEKNSLPELRLLSKADKVKSGDNWAGLVERRAARIEEINDEPALPAYVWLFFIGLALTIGWLIESGRLNSYLR